MIVVIAHTKGGSGKTTTAVQLALCRQITHTDRKVWLIDTDEQQSAFDTVRVRSSQELKPSLECAAISSAKHLMNQLNAKASSWDDVIIDCGGRDTDSLRVALLAADKVIVPVLPRAYDIWSLSKLDAVIQVANKFRKTPVQIHAFINRRDRSADCRDAIKYLEANESFLLMTASLSDRMAYPKAGGVGKSVLEMRPADKKAQAEIRTLCEEIFQDTPVSPLS